MNAWRRALGIGYANPERYIVLTQVGNDWQTVRGRMKDLAYRLRQDLGPQGLQWAWTVEWNPAGTGHHVNAYQWGAFVPKRSLTAQAVRQGMGEVTWITRLKSSNAAGYALKLAGAPSYGLKEAGDELRAERYLEVNGERLTHQTRGFWRHPGGSALDSDRPAREAERLALARAFGADPGEWVRERDPEVN